jgi:hypothetical protein
LGWCISSAYLGLVVYLMGVGLVEGVGFGFGFGLGVV